ncbi:MAG: right-handed parallel beta-helix repeat-containing protein [Clostridia bacterium]|nr:right-handed parallel beta-helix repeat-containing protein [Clostridia bacterium]
MSIYYVSNSGCDCKDGLTPETAWATIGKVNATIQGGDTVKFECGGTYYGRIQPPAGIDPEHRTTLTTYGEGKKPVVSQYKIIKPEAWVEVDKNVWRVDMNDTANFDGNHLNINNNVGFVKVSGKIWGTKRFKLEDLAGQWDFYNDDEGKQYAWVYSEGNPASLSDDIRFACNIGCVGFADNLDVHGIVFNGTGGHGISGVVNYSTITDCEFHEIGGSRLIGYPNPTTRYGNGVETWANSSNVTVDNCRFSDVYDVAITMQGRPVKKSWTNMHFTNNVMWNCVQCFEIWSSGDVPDTGFEDCWFEGNTCIDSGWCWGYEARPNKTCSCHLLLYHLDCPRCDITIRNNTFYNARVSTIFKSGGPKEMPEDYKIYDNVIIRKVGQDLIFRADNTEEQYNAFADKIIANNIIRDL